MNIFGQQPKTDVSPESIPLYNKPPGDLSKMKVERRKLAKKIMMRLFDMHQRPTGS